MSDSHESSLFVQSQRPCIGQLLHTLKGVGNLHCPRRRNPCSKISSCSQEELGLLDRLVVEHVHTFAVTAPEAGKVRRLAMLPATNFGAGSSVRDGSSLLSLAADVSPTC